MRPVQSHGEMTELVESAAEDDGPEEPTALAAPEPAAVVVTVSLVSLWDDDDVSRRHKFAVALLCHVHTAAAGNSQRQRARVCAERLRSSKSTGRRFSVST